MAKRKARPAPAGKTRIEVLHTFESGIATVFRSWTDPELISAWMPGTENAVAAETTVSTGRNGGYRCKMSLAGGGELVMQGRNTTFDPPTGIAYRLSWDLPDDAPPVPETRVSVDLARRGKGTEVRLRHSGLKPEMTDSVAAAWQAAFNRLEMTLAPGGRVTSLAP